MITHAIIKYAPKTPTRKPTQQKAKFQGKMGSMDHLLFILERAYINCDLKVNDIVIHRKKEYTVNAVYGPEDINWLTWNGLSPEFVELIDSDGVFMYVNPGVLRKVGHKRRK